MGGINAAVELQETFAGILTNIINVANMSAAAVEQFHAVMNQPIDTASVQEARERLNQAAQGDGNPAPPVEVPVVWNQDALEVSAGTGIERFRQEAASANAMLTAINRTQTRIAAKAARTDIFSSDMDEVRDCVQMIQEQIQEIGSSRLDMGADGANAQLEQQQAYLNQAIQLQERMNQIVEHMNVQKAGSAYLQQSQTKENTQKRSGDNAGGQRSSSTVIVDAVKNAKKIVEGKGFIFQEIFNPENIAEFIQDGVNGYDAQLNTELQLMTALADRVEKGYATQIGCEITTDQTDAVEGINGIQDSVSDVEITAVLRKEAMLAEFDAIIEKINEIEARGIYGGEVMAGAAAEFAVYFQDTDAIEVMLDTLADYAMGMEKGVSEPDVSKMRTYAANLGKVMSGDYSAMSNSGLNFSEAQKAVIQGEAAKEQMISVLGEENLDMSSDMQAAVVITQVVDKADAGLYETMSSTPEGQMMQMTNMWGNMKGDAGEQLYPYVLSFTNTISQNWGTIQTVIDGIVIGLEYMLGVMSGLLTKAFEAAQSIIDNWGQILPVVGAIIYGIVGVKAAYIAYLAVETISTTMKKAMIIAEYAYAAATRTTVRRTTEWIAAQMGLNTAFLASPITWIVAGIIALIAVIYIVIAIINKVTKSTISAAGVICGSVMAAGAFLFNTVIGVINAIFQAVYSFAEPVIGIFEWILNAASGGFDGFGGAVANLIGQIISWFLSLGKIVTKIIDAIFGTDWTSGLSELQDNVLSWGKNDSALTLERSPLTLDYRIGYEDAWNNGYSFGEKIDESIKNFDPSSLFKTTELPSAEDYAGKLLDGGIGTGVENIDENTGAMTESMEITGEELKYLRDIAEQEAINRFTTAEINIEQTNHNTIKNDMDLDGVVSGLECALGEAVEIMTEGVHE